MDAGTLVSLLAIIGAAVAGAAFAFFALRRFGAAEAVLVEDELAVELQELRHDQRRLGEALLTQLHEATAVHLEHERRRATTELDGKKALIDQQLGAMTSELGKVGDLVRGLDAERQQSYGELANELRRAQEGLNSLNDTTGQLREALAGQKTRGQWGERIAEDVLRLHGLIEGVNYRKQQTLAASGGRPDYTFLLPNQLVLHMDVKFPLDNYMRHREAESELEQRRFRDQFLRDVRDRMKELAAREYLDDQSDTVDCLLMFIPSEQVYAFVHEHDRQLLDDAMRNRIVVCSPLTLYAVLAVVRQAVDNFRLEKTSSEILEQLQVFSQQWEKYVAQLEKIQQRFDGVAKEYTALMSTRHRALQRPLDRIDALRTDEPSRASPQIPPLALEG